MSLKRNIAANFVSQIYATVLSIVMLPLYLRYMGAEAYGLVGFFAAMQGWFQIMDMGLTPTMGRETARLQGGSIDSVALRSLLRSMEVIFVGTALVVGLAIGLGAPSIARHWLNVQTLQIQEVERAVLLMGLILALRWISGLYRSAINGFERMTWLGAFNAVIATARFVIIIPIFIFVGSTPTDFFVFQVMVAAVELIVLMLKNYQLMPAADGPRKNLLNLDWDPFNRVVKFAMGIAYASGAWVLVTQTDKLILSKLLTLTDYAHFSLAVLVASGVLVLTSPISSTMVARLSRLQAEGKQDELVRNYRQVTQLITAAAISTALVLSVFSGKIIWVLTGDPGISKASANILSLYAIGNGIFIVSTFQAYLQFAKGDMKLHIIGNTLFVAFLIPSLIISTIKFGGEGAGYAWLAANIIYFLFWVPRVHARLYPNLHKIWCLRDVLFVSIFAIGGAFFAKQISTLDGFQPDNRITLAFLIIVCGIITVGISSLGIDWVTTFLKQKFKLTRRAGS